MNSFPSLLLPWQPAGNTISRTRGAKTCTGGLPCWAAAHSPTPTRPPGSLATAVTIAIATTAAASALAAGLGEGAVSRDVLGGGGEYVPGRVEVLMR